MKCGITNTFECYNPQKNQWIKLASMCYKRMNFALIQLNGFIYAIGHNEFIEKYNPLENKWTTICNHPRTITVINAINIDDDELYILHANGKIERIEIDAYDNILFHNWVIESNPIAYENYQFLSLN